MKKIALVALGGNAIIQRGEQTTITKQFQRISKSLRCIIPLLKKGYAVVITHGNGPQVGNILIRVEEALGKAYPLPLEVCVAESQGEIGYMIEQSLQNLLRQHNRKDIVVTVLTQVVVDKHDPYFKRPTKPVGPWLNRRQAERLKRKGKSVKQIGKQYRRVVPSPRPLRVVECRTIKELLEHNIIVIAAGGGGIPVYQTGKKLMGIEAVIDKDLASACLARDLQAELFLILTDVDSVYLDYGKPNKQRIAKMTVQQAKQHLKQGIFPEGSMGPKVQAAVHFVAARKRKAIITSLEKVEKALQGKAGTTVMV